MIDVDAIEKRKQELSEAYTSELDDMYKEEVKNCIRWFKEKFPKRTIEWCSGMGTCFWILDGEILHWTTMEYKYVPTYYREYGDGVKHQFGGNHAWFESKPDKIAEVLWPLWVLYQSINDATHVLGPPIDTGDVRMEDV